MIEVSLGLEGLADLEYRNDDERYVHYAKSMDFN